MTRIKIDNKFIGHDQPTYFIAEIGANHEGSLNQAIDLIKLAANAGADAVKFQHYRADHLASKEGFNRLNNLAHYTDNPHTVFSRYAIPWDWTPGLRAACELAGVEFMSTPYDFDAATHLAPYVNAFKIGSGDITYHDLIRHVAAFGKPVILSTGASDLSEVLGAMSILPENVCIMQCNTNYSGAARNYSNINLRVLEEYAYLFPYAVLGISVHTPSMAPVLGAVTLGARVVEAHFTDLKEWGHSPDRPFAMTAHSFEYMVKFVRQLEASMGDGVKRVEANEAETVVLQRRCLRAARPLAVGTVLAEADFAALRPAPAGSLPPYRIGSLVGKTLQREMAAEEEFSDECVN